MPRFADVITTHNQYLKDHLSRWFHRRVFLIPQGVDTELFNPARFDGKEGKRRLGLEGKVVFCFLGSFTKGSAADLDVILEAFKQVSLEKPEAHLMIIGGGGPLKDHYLQYIKHLGLENIVITGRKAQQEIPRYLAYADYGLVFMRENQANRFRMSLKVLEYLAMDLPVIGHLVGGTRDALGDLCLTCYPTVDSLKDRILNAIMERPDKTSVRKHIVEQYDWKRFVPLLDHVIQTSKATKRSV
jgi:glycosyltransferase involved in cell wall biosynthesis